MNLNKLKKEIKCKALLSILSLFHYKFNRFNNTEAQNVGVFLSYDASITLIFVLGREKFLFYRIYIQYCSRHHSVKLLKYVNMVYPKPGIISVQSRKF